ncbi:hypothetical protein DFP98_11375 [Cohnella phaseoli]|uniref:Uncharacterized protein n=1 Tax=Cohnella phaseoli TaxID=456490 RepID=A0A3D9JPV8_9BACL|nr:hypothetical protein DFP98_11375 [Cohnella phaseoli]
METDVLNYANGGTPLKMPIPYVLTHDSDFQHAIWFQWPISVFNDGDCIYEGGIVDEFDDVVVLINNKLFFKHSWQFVRHLAVQNS